MNRAMRFCGCAANLGRLNLVRASHLAHMQYSEFNRHMEELGATGKTVVDGAVIDKCEKCGQAVVEGEGHHCLLPRKYSDCRTASNAVRGIEKTCEYCRKDYKTMQKKRARFCSESCREKSRKFKDTERAAREMDLKFAYILMKATYRKDELICRDEMGFFDTLEDAIRAFEDCVDVAEWQNDIKKRSRTKTNEVVKIKVERGKSINYIEDFDLKIKDGKTKAEIWIMEVPIGIIVPMQINGVSMTEKKIELARKWRSKQNDNHR